MHTNYFTLSLPSFLKEMLTSNKAHNIGIVNHAVKSSDLTSYIQIAKILFILTFLLL